MSPTKLSAVMLVAAMCLAACGTGETDAQGEGAVETSVAGVTSASEATATVAEDSAEVSTTRVVSSPVETPIVEETADYDLLVHGKEVSVDELAALADSDPEIGADLARVIINYDDEFATPFTRADITEIGTLVCTEYSTEEIRQLLDFFTGNEEEEDPDLPWIIEVEAPMILTDYAIHFPPGTTPDDLLAMGPAGALLAAAAGAICPYPGYHAELLS